MVEQLSVYVPESDLALLTRQEVAFVQCLTNGMTISEISEFLGINSAVFREQLAIKMISDPNLEETLAGVERLPFVAGDMLSKTQAMVYSLKNIGFRTVEVAKMLNMDQANVGKHSKKAERKKLAKKDRIIPDIGFEKGENSQPVGLIKAIHFVIKEKLDGFEMIGDPEVNLSFGESTALLWRCTGRTEAQIAQEMETSCRSVQTYLKRASKKLGVCGKYPLIARTLLEIMRDQKKARVRSV